MNYKIALIKGDGIGPEIVDEAVKVLDRVGVKYGHTFDYTRVLMGGESIDACGVPLTDEAIAQCKASDSVLMGSIGGNTTTSPWYQDFKAIAGMNDVKLYGGVPPVLLDLCFH